MTEYNEEYTVDTQQCSFCGQPFIDGEPNLQVLNFKMEANFAEDTRDKHESISKAHIECGFMELYE